MFFFVIFIDILSPGSSGRCSSASMNSTLTNTNQADCIGAEEPSYDSDDEFRKMVASAEINNKKTQLKGKEKKKGGKQSFQQELLALQKEQMAYQKEQEKRHEEFLKYMMEEQRKVEQEERDKDRDFFLKLGQMFAGKGN